MPAAPFGSTTFIAAHTGGSYDSSVVCLPATPGWTSSFSRKRHSYSGLREDTYVPLSTGKVFVNARKHRLCEATLAATKRRRHSSLVLCSPSMHAKITHTHTCVTFETLQLSGSFESFSFRVVTCRAESDIGAPHETVAVTTKPAVSTMETQRNSATTKLLSTYSFLVRVP